MVSSGTGAGIGIALGLLVLFLAGPGAYYYRKRQRRQLDETGEHGSRYSELIRAGDERFGADKPQLEDTAVSPPSAWRSSRSTVDTDPIVVPEVAAGTALGIHYANPITQEGRMRELDVSTQGRRPELPTKAAIPPPTELRAEKSPPVESVAVKDAGAHIYTAVESQEDYAKSDESINFPALPGPVLPPKQR